MTDKLPASIKLLSDRSPAVSMEIFATGLPDRSTPVDLTSGAAATIVLSFLLKVVSALVVPTNRLTVTVAFALVTTPCK